MNTSMFVNTSMYTESSSGLVLDAEKAKEYAMLSQVADMYYNCNMKVTEIAAELLFSPAKVSRLLAQAREKGIVEIRVRRIAGRLTEMEAHLKSIFSLKDAIVINSFKEEAPREELEIITDFAAEYTANLLRGRKTLGITNGTSVNLVVGKIQPTHACELDIVQLIGSGGGANKDIESRHLANFISEIYPGGRTFFLNTPIYIDNSAARQGLMEDGTISQTFHMMRNCDIILTGIGAFDEKGGSLPEIIREYQTPAHIRELQQKNAAGSVCAQFYDVEGNLIDCTWNKNCMSMSFEDLRKNPMTIGVACGDAKIIPILGALRAGLINVLVTGAHVASALCSLSSLSH